MGANNSKNLFKQLELALVKIDELTEKVNKIERDAENKYLKIIYELEEKYKKEIALLKEENEAQRIKIALLEQEIERLKKQIDKNSGNSSKPPSSDIKPNIYNLRVKGEKNSGGQVGHKGCFLSKEKISKMIEDKEAVHKVIERRNGGTCEEFISKFVVDLKVETIVTEYRFYKDKNGKFSVPKEFRPDVQYGNDLKTLVTTLVGQGIVASNRIVDLISEATSNTINLSDGSVYNFLNEFNLKAAKTIDSIKAKVLNVPIMHVDETGSRCSGKNMFFRNYSNQKHTVYTFNPTKSIKDIEFDGILPQYAGILVHDHNTTNYNYGLNNAECNVHILRYLKASFENTNNAWPQDFAELLLRMKNTKGIAMAFGLEKFDDEKITEFSQLYDTILEEGFKSAKNTKSKIYKKDELRLLNRLKKYKENHLLFVTNFLVPFDNNLSERDLRTVKTKTKVSGCFRSLSGGRIYANLMSVIKTSIKQKLSPYKIIASIFKTAEFIF